MTTFSSAWLFAALGWAASAQAASITYQIEVDTSSVEATNGYLDFQFNPGNPPSDPASATLTDFTTDGILTGPLLPDLGAVTGALPGTVVIDNTDALNEHTEGFTYGSFFDVFVTLDIPTVSGTASSGSSFALSVWDTNFLPVLTGDPLVEIDLEAITGTPSVINNSVNGVAVVTAVTQTPEPGSLPVVGMGLAALVVLRFRQRSARFVAGVYLRRSPYVTHRSNFRSRICSLAP